MKTTTTTLSQAFLRLALSASYLSAVADRFGLWGAPGTPGVSWGNWQNFIAYSNSVNSFVPPLLGNVLAIVATTLEVILPALLLIGYKIRLASLASGIVLLLFALAMTISFGMKAPLDYSVWTGAAASFLLSALPTYPYSLDQAIASNR
ncbi:DoxX family membrane protein [Fulvivirgaceae bacterium PWU5]|uniref:DoxX family membrane protein n=1 Tax=Dawidia cretensis TaxID=2782350 RepID=A0AAP2GNI7_9BACT|nr:DoxX family membrane protein [Dawidia cretensis]MBT1707219.1 DoxX family membrane protein [Dawidia cretensis]